MSPKAGIFSSPVNVFPVAHEEDNECPILSVTNDAVVADAKAVLADVRPDKRLRERQGIRLLAVPVELLNEPSLRVPRELLEFAKSTGSE